MREELENQLAKDFSFMKARNVWTGELCFDDYGNTYGFPCECNDGWYQLIYDLCKEIENHYKNNKADINELRIYQIKEKFASLRFYTGNVINGVFDIISKYEDQSMHVCEVCGAEGEIKKRHQWLKTLCDSCAKELGYE